MDSIKIVNYEAGHQPYFEQFNKAWIQKYFRLEAIDEYVLTYPEEAIISKGGAILMALYENEVAGTVALKKVSEDVFEFTKMAVREDLRRKGIAGALTRAAFEKAKALGARKVILYSQTELAAAIQLYKTSGFTEIPLEPGVYKRANIKMEKELH